MNRMCTTTVDVKINNKKERVYHQQSITSSSAALVQPGALLARAISPISEPAKVGHALSAGVMMGTPPLGVEF